MNKEKVFLVCTGVGHVNRGYESFTEECFDQLKNSKHFELFMLKGAGVAKDHHIPVFCIRRNSRFAFFINRLLKTNRYWLEQFTFLFGMLPSIIRHKPHLIYYSDFILGTFLWHLKRFFKFKYRLLFSNGAPNGPPFTRMDHVQQLLPMYLKEAEKAGTPFKMQTLLPYAISVEKKKNLELINRRIDLLNELQIPMDKRVIICVGAINSHHKRIDYLISEFSSMNNRPYFLIVLGQIDQLSLPILSMAQETLQEKNFLIKQVDGSEVIRYLSVADYFVLPSLHEGLPRVLPEAMSVGLLPIVHDYQVTRETLGDFGVFMDLTKKDVLQNAIDEVDRRRVGKETLIDFAFNHYSWQCLSVKYKEMIVKNL